MKKFACVLAVIFFFSACPACAGMADRSFTIVAFSAEMPSGLTKDEQTAWKLIQKVKKFEETLGMKPTKNFLVYKEKEDGYNLLFYCKKTEMPFSYLDPLLVMKSSTLDNLEDNLKALAEIGITPEEYDIYFYVTQGQSGGTVVTKRLLNSEPEEIVGTVLHEDFHDNCDIPFHFNESAAVIFEFSGMCKFMDYEPTNLLEYVYLIARKYDICHEELTLLAKNLKDGSISMEEYLKSREECLARLTKRLGKENASFLKNLGDEEVLGKCYLKLKNEWFIKLLKRMKQENITSADVADNHSYFHYYGLMYLLLRCCGREPAVFLEYLNKVPYKDPGYNDGDDQQKYFDATREAELKLEVYVLDYIKSVIGQNKKSR